MNFLNSQLVGDMHSVCYTPMQVDKFKKVKLQNAIFDAFYVTNDIYITPSAQYPKTWDVDTIMYAEFQNTVSAGSVDWQKTDVPMFVIKRRESGQDNDAWITIAKYDIVDGDTVNNMDVDFLNASKITYDYAFVPIRKGAEGEYIMNSVYSEFDGICVMERGSYWWSPITDAKIDTTRNIEKSFNAMLNNRYPVSVTRAVTNYDSGSATGMFLPFDETECKFISADSSRVKYQRAFTDFLTNYQPKILKTLDGRIWLVDVAPSPEDRASNYYDERYVTFTWHEIGRHDSEKDLFRSNLITVEEEFWSKNYSD